MAVCHLLAVRLATGVSMNHASVWDLKHPDAPPVVVGGGEIGPTALAFAPDGRLVTVGYNNKMRLWDLDLTNQINRARLSVGRNLTKSEWEQFCGQEPYHRTFPELPDGLGVADGPGAPPSTISVPSPNEGTSTACSRRLDCPVGLSSPLPTPRTTLTGSRRVETGAILRVKCVCRRKGLTTFPGWGLSTRTVVRRTRGKVTAKLGTNTIGLDS